MTTLEFLNKAYLIASNYVKVEDLEFKQSKSFVKDDGIRLGNNISLCIFYRNENGERDNFSVFSNAFRKEHSTETLLREFQRRLKEKFQKTNHPELELGL